MDICQRLAVQNIASLSLEPGAKREPIFLSKSCFAIYHLQFEPASLAPEVNPYPFSLRSAFGMTLCTFPSSTRSPVSQWMTSNATIFLRSNVPFSQESSECKTLARSNKFPSKPHQTSKLEPSTPRRKKSSRWDILGYDFFFNLRCSSDTLQPLLAQRVRWK